MNYRRIVNVLALVLVIAIVVPFVVYTIPGLIGADHSFLVLSGSMEPELSPGDAILVEETGPQAIQEGDVITFVRSEGDTPVTHRVVEVHETDDGLAFETKGDANEQRDSGTVPAENVIGTLALTIPYIGYVVQFANTTTGFALLVGVPIALLVISEVWSAVRSSGDDSDDSTAAESDDVDSAQPANETGAEAIENGGTGNGGAEMADADESDAVTLDLTDLTLTLGLLAVIAPYAVYVAIQLQSTLTITVAFAACFSVVLLGGLRFSLWASTGASEDESGDDTAVNAETTLESSTPAVETPTEAEPSTEPEPSAEPESTVEHVLDDPDLDRVDGHWPGAFEGLDADAPADEPTDPTTDTPTTDGGIDSASEPREPGSPDSETNGGTTTAARDPTDADGEVDR